MDVLFAIETWVEFQSSPTPEDGRCRMELHDDVLRIPVSILARPRGRALLAV